ncbi:MAG: hypothetical protein Q9219_000748 [cf. Caloplaca sp. 3 TL-2023]
MATSLIHPASSHTYPPPPAFSQESTESSISGAHLSQGPMQSFDGGQSLASTPTPTPPTSRGQHQISSFNTAAYPPPNGVPIQQAPPIRYHEPNGLIPQQQYPPGHKPQIYTAVYSSVAVYEMEVNGIAVMRRRSDSWLNATQILKVAGIDKGKRTKVLEKEILSGEHEKVQGGYGKYQGTWINYFRGVDFCRQYGVADLLRPLLEYDMGQDGTTAAGQGHINTPTKEQAMAAQRKRNNLMDGSLNTRPSPQSQGGTFFSNISKTAAHAVNAINKAHANRNISNGRPPTQARRPSSQQMFASQESAFQPSSQHSTQSLHSDHSFATNTHLDPALRPRTQPFLDMDVTDDMNEPPRKRARPSSSQGRTMHGLDHDTSITDLAVPNMNGSFLHPNSQVSLPVHKTGLLPLPAPVSAVDKEKKQLILSLFEDDNRRDFSTHPAIIRLSGEDLDIPIDETAHTALHWAATLARIHVVRALVSKGASVFRLNGGGETALMRAAITTNNFDNNTFTDVLKLLGTSIEIRDGRGQTVLHHIAASSAISGRAHATRSYLDSILLYLVGNSGAPNSQQNSFDELPDGNDPNIPRPIGLAKFMAEVVNARDIAGDTALHCAAKIGNKGIVQQLLEIGADSLIENRNGLRPIDIPGVGGDPKSTNVTSSQAAREDNVSESKFDEAHRRFMESVTTLLDDAKKAFEAERQKKQTLINQALENLRDNKSRLSEERGKLQQLTSKADERDSLRLKIANLQRANQGLRSTLGNRPDLRTNITTGEADAGLEVHQPPFGMQQSGDVFAGPTTTGGLDERYLGALPPSDVLNARADAYRSNNEQLEMQLQELRSQSSVLEAQLRKVVSLCTRVDPGRVDELVPRLLAAVESERGKELDEERLHELLRRVEREGEGE